MEKRKTTKNSAVYTTHHLANTKIPVQQLMNDTAASRVTYTVGIMQPIVLLTHPFDACIKAAQSAGFAEGTQKVQVLVAKLQSFERHITQLEGQLQGSEMLESEKMEGQLHHHQETTSGISDTLATVNTTVTAAVCIFHKFVPGAPFHPPISHSTAALPTNSVIPSHANSPLERDKHQSVSQSMG